MSNAVSQSRHLYEYIGMVRSTPAFLKSRVCVSPRRTLRSDEKRTVADFIPLGRRREIGVRLPR